MNFDFAEEINPYLERGHFAEAVVIAEDKLSALPESPFHAIIGNSLLSQAASLCSWIDEFHAAVVEHQEPVAALYFELTEFDINTDEWCIEGFAYATDLGLEDPEWLSGSSIADTADSSFVVTRYESLQRAFEEIELDSDELENARDWCEQLIIVRYMELVYAAHKLAQQEGLTWSTLPLYCTEHGYDFITRSSNS
ncbi:hypothetical protein GCM10027346_29170 [Hymenobacter seoulensis]